MADPSFHHVGFVVASIDEAMPRWRSGLCPVAVRGPWVDETQRVRVIFLEFAGPGSLIELVEPLAAGSPVARFLSQGGGMHHVCFEVDDLDAHVAAMKGQQALLVRRPVPATAFEGRRIAWMMTRDKLLVEYLERAKA